MPIQIDMKMPTSCTFCPYEEYERLAEAALDALVDK